MAFNPFHKFRKHQKTLIAGLAIFTMFMFVAYAGSSGGGDFISAVASYFGGKGKSNSPVVAELYGKEVTDRDLVTLNTQRRIARVFLENIFLQGRAKIAEGFNRQPGHEKMPPEQISRFLRFDPKYRQMEDNFSRLPLYTPDAQDLIDFKIWLHQADELGIHLTNGDVMKLVFQMVGNQGKAQGQNQAPKEDSINYKDVGKLIKDMAQSGKFKNLTDDSVMKAVGDEFRVQLAQMALEGYEPRMRGMMDLTTPKAHPIVEVPAVPTPDQFWTYYKDRCSTIKVALVPVKADNFISKVEGKPTEDELQKLYDKGKNKEYDPLSSDPGFMRPRRVQVQWVSGKADSPYYRKAAREQMKIVNAAQLLGAVGNPTLGAAVNTALPDFEDRALIADYMSRSTNMPYQISTSYANVPWLERWGYTYDRLRPQSVYRPANVAALVGQLGLVGSVPAPVPAANAVAGLEAPALTYEMRQKITIGLTSVLSFMSPSPVAGATTATATARYSETLGEYVPFSLVRSQLADETFNRTQRRLLENNLDNLKQVLGMKMTPAQVLPMAFLTTPAMPNAVVAALATEANETVILKDPETEKTVNTLRDNLVARLIKDYDLETGKTSEPRSLHGNKIGDDPGLKPLKDAILKPPSEDPTGEAFSNRFFGFDRVYDTTMWPPRSEFTTAEKQYMYWKTEDQPSLTLPLEPEPNAPVTAAGAIGLALMPGNGPLSAVVAYKGGSSEPETRRRVEQAWRLQKARDLAKKDAEKAIKDKIAKIAEEVAKDKASPEAKISLLEKKLNDLAAEMKTQVIVLDPVAEATLERSTEGAVEYRHRGPKIDRKKVPDLTPEQGPLPPQFLEQIMSQLPADRAEKLMRGTSYGEDFAMELLKLKDKPRGDTIVLPDKPQATFYVAVLLDQKEPDRGNFFQVYRNMAGGSGKAETFFDGFVQKLQVDYRRDLIKRLREDAKLKIMKDNLPNLGGGPGDDF